jgi:hypothetical protein
MRHQEHQRRPRLVQPFRRPHALATGFEIQNRTRVGCQNIRQRRASRRRILQAKYNTGMRKSAAKGVGVTPLANRQDRFTRRWWVELGDGLPNLIGF